MFKEAPLYVSKLFMVYFTLHLQADTALGKWMCVIDAPIGCWICSGRSNKSQIGVNSSHLPKHAAFALVSEHDATQSNADSSIFPSLLNS